MPEVVTLGETMVVFDGVRTGPLRYVETYERHSGGAETNVAVALIRLGHSAGWISRVGDDEFGRYIISFFRGEGVDTSQVKIDPQNPTGVFFRQRWESGENENFYYRKGSAASLLTPEDVDEEYISQAKYLHVTGITPALSSSCLATVEKVLRVAKAKGVKVSFDPNIRLKLWPSEEAAAKTLLKLLEYSDLFFPGIDECEILFDTTNLNHIFSKVEALGVETTVVKLGTKGAVARQGNEQVKADSFQVATVSDTFGAGDAFAAGFLAGQLKGWSLREAVVFANAAGALAVTVKGNVEAFPTFKQVEMFIKGQKKINR